MTELIEIVSKYNYPPRLFDFESNKEIIFDSYRNLEGYLRENLMSNDLSSVNNGLSNVLYWGHYRAGYRDVRVERFKAKITNDKLEKFQRLIIKNDYNCLTIKSLGMPEFSGLAFVSKVLMFLDPHKYVTLDKKIMQLSDHKNLKNPLSNIKFGGKDTTIRISQNTHLSYTLWCELCKKIADENFQDKLPVDIERGFFKLVENKDIEIAKRIIREQTN